MTTHDASCLEGPITRAREWWRFTNPEPAPTPETPVMNDTPNPPTPTDIPFRADLVERIRREIAAGTYETPEKWEIALGRLIERWRTDRRTDR